MKAIILSAGKGTRVRQLDPSIPKPLMNIAGKPMILWNIELLKNNGIIDIAINTHYLANKIKEYLGDGKKWGVNLRYSYEPKLLGTSGALNNFRDFLDERFVVIYADIISNMNLKNLIDFHKEKKSLATLVVHKTDHPEDSDIVQIDKHYRVINLIKKPGSDSFGDLGNAALYVVEPQIFNYLPKGKSDFIRDVFPKMISKGENIYADETSEFINDAGTPERLEKIEKILNKGEY